MTDNRIDHPLTLTLGNEELIIRRLYELISHIQRIPASNWES